MLTVRGRRGLVRAAKGVGGRSYVGVGRAVVYPVFDYAACLTYGNDQDARDVRIDAFACVLALV